MVCYIIVRTGNEAVRSWAAKSHPNLWIRLRTYKDVCMSVHFDNVNMEGGCV